MSIEARNRLLPDWFTRIRTRQTVLPRFQRFEAWDHARVAQMFNTLLRELPLGSVLILEVGNEEPFTSRTLSGAPEIGERVNEHLLDGQQRLTGLWRALHNNYEGRTFFLYFERDDETGMPYYVGTLARWRREDDKEDRPFWANRPEDQWKRRMVPLDLLSPDLPAEKRFRAWSKEAIPDEEEREEISSQVSLIRQRLASFNIPFLSLPVTTKKETALDVFMKMNTSFAPLTMYDIVVAQIEASLGQSLHDLVGEVRRASEAIEHYYSPEGLAMYASALLQNRAPTNANYLAKDFGPRMVENWSTLLAGVSRTVEFLEQERIFDADRLPTDVVVPVLVALFGAAPKGLDPEGRARAILRKYVWRAFFSNRYENSTNSRALADHNELQRLIAGKLDKRPEIFDNEVHSLPLEQELINAGWPKRRDRLARAILALSLRNGGLDLADGGVVTRQNLRSREYHHVFPDAHLRRIGIPDDSIFRSLNCALVTWRTNRNISDKDPERYLAERRQSSDPADAELKTRLASHYIPYEEMVAGDYPKFLARRASIVHEAMTGVCG